MYGVIYILYNIFNWFFAVFLITLLVALAVYFDFLKRFKAAKKFFLPLIFSLALFVFGFFLRLQDAEAIVDLGFFFTDFSYLLVWVVFSSSAVLGQKKYYKR